MSDRTFRAFVVREQSDGRMQRHVETQSPSDLPPGEVLIRVHYSSLNYKDALSAAGNKGVTRTYPHTTGIDAAGVVQSSEHPDFSTGQKVIVTGYDLGMNTPGGHGEYIRTPASWVVPLPEGLSLKESMGYGTAGFTAALSVLRMQHMDIVPGREEILVTGASGGVGSIAVGILARLGYDVVAVTRRPAEATFLRELGASSLVTPDEVMPESDRPLARGRWAGVIDTVGGAMLDGALRSTQPRGSVTCCGNIASGELSSSIYPFILRGISLLGIDSAACPMPERQMIWHRLAGDWRVPGLAPVVAECALDDLSQRMDAMLAGHSHGRVRVNLCAEDR